MTIQFKSLSEFINVDEFVENEIKERKKKSFPYRGSSFYGFRSLNWFEKVMRVDDVVDEIYTLMFFEYQKNYEHWDKHDDVVDIEKELKEIQKITERIQTKIFEFLGWDELLIESFYDDRLSEEVEDLRYREISKIRGYKVGS